MNPEAKKNMTAATRKTPRDPAAGVGVFDSGLGGLSILSEIVRILPGENVNYFADNLHLPYGPRPLEEVRRFAVAIADKLIQLPCKLVVVACNTASAAALKYLRQTYPDTFFVGMEPAIKPAAAESGTGVVGVLATQATFQGELFESVVHRFAQGVEILRQPCPGLAEFIEHHPPDHPTLRAMLEKFIRPLVERGADNLVLGCTHYALVKDLIRDVAGPGVHIVDPSPAIARRTARVLADENLLSPSDKGRVKFFVSGDDGGFVRAASLYLGREIAVERTSFRWIPVNREEGGVVRRKKS